MPELMASPKGLEPLVVSSNLTSTTKTLLKKNRISSCQQSGEKILALGPQKLELRVGDTLTRISCRDLNIPPFQGGRVL